MDLVHGTWYMVHGTGTWYMVHGTGTWYGYVVRVRGTGTTWYMYLVRVEAHEVGTWVHMYIHDRNLTGGRPWRMVGTISDNPGHGQGA